MPFCVQNGRAIDVSRSMPATGRHETARFAALCNTPLQILSKTDASTIPSAASLTAAGGGGREGEACAAVEIS